MGYFPDKELQKCSSILVLVSSGLLIMLTGKSSQLLYISAPVYIALFNRNQSILVSSDGADFMLAKIKFDDTGVIQESSIKSKVKGEIFILCIFYLAHYFYSFCEHHFNIFYLQWFYINRNM